MIDDLLFISDHAGQVSLMKPSLSNVYRWKNRPYIDAGDVKAQPPEAQAIPTWHPPTYL